LQIFLDFMEFRFPAEINLMSSQNIHDFFLQNRGVFDKKVTISSQTLLLPVKF